MNIFLQKHHRLVFYAAWLFLGMTQSGFTELQDDEAYYWVYSKFLSWGYFDHPPMIALLMKMGYSIFPNELGVRLFPLLLNLLTLFIIEKLLVNKNPFLFYAILLSVAALQLTGFMAVPDIPLIFFTALFFLCYRNFCFRQNLKYSLILGLSMALLFYTKYHAVLLVLFTVLSNLKLFTKPWIYLSGIITLLLFSPHLVWQWDHNWVSFRYHLFESNVNAYKFSFTTEYLGGQLLLAGPIAGIILLPAAFLYKTKSATEKAMRWTMIGIYLFFLFSSFRGKVEMNWTAPVLIPLIILSHQCLIEKIKWQNRLFRLLPLSLILVLCMRIVMIENIAPVKAIEQRYHAWKAWPDQMRKLTKGLPVVFSNSYQRASKYWFYSGQITYSQNHVQDHRNNYNFWPIEDQLIGKPVYFLDIYNSGRFGDSLKTPIGYVGYRYDSVCNSLAKIKFVTAKNVYTIQTGESLTLKVRKQMPGLYFSYVNKNDKLVAAIKIYFFSGRKIVNEVLLPIKLQDHALGEFETTIKPKLPAGSYQFNFSIATPGYNPTHNSEKIQLIIE